MRRFILSVLIAISLLYILLMGFFWLFEPSFIFFPDYPSRKLQSVAVPHEDIYLTTVDGVSLHGWIIRSEHPSTVWMIMFHGNAGNISGREEYYVGMRALGMNVVAIDYRGYGKSGGKPNEAGLYKDAIACYDFLIREFRVDANRIVVFGHSLGSAVASYLAAERSVGALIVEGALTSVAEMGQELYPFLPVRLLVCNTFDSMTHMGRISCPVLFLHAREDEIIPIKHGRRLYERVEAEKSFVELSRHHNDAFLDAAYFPAVQNFLRTQNLLEE